MFLMFLITKAIFDDSNTFITSNFELLVSRFLCAMLLHMQLEKEIRSTIYMLKYLAAHSDKFDGIFMPFMITLM